MAYMECLGYIYIIYIDIVHVLFCETILVSQCSNMFNSCV